MPVVRVVVDDVHREWHTVNDQIGLWADQPLRPCTRTDELVHVTALTESQLDLEFAARRAHESQTAPDS